jgi:hypothetical protein
MRLAVACLALVAPVIAAQGVPEWRVDREPAIRVAATGTDGAPVFGTATWATRLSNGEIALADGGDRTVRIIATDGRVLRSHGREGRGPGEFASLGWIGGCGTDSLFAWDFVLARMSVLLPETGHARTWGNTEMRSTTNPSCSRTAEFALGVRFRRTAESKPAVSARSSIGGDYRVWVDTFDVQTYDADGNSKRDVPRAVRQESIVGRLPDGRFSGLARPLGFRTDFVFSGNDLAVAWTDSGRVFVYAMNAARGAEAVSEGRASRTFLVGRGDARATAAQYEAAVLEAMLDAPPNAREQFGAFARSVPAPERLPAVQRMFADPAGLLWFVVSQPGERETRLRAYRSTGEAVASLTVPVAMLVFEVGDEHVLGRTEDAEGEQSVVLYRFTRR